VVIDESDEQAESWSGLSAQPHWKGEAKPFGGGDDFSDLVDSGPRLGALDTSPTTSSGGEEFFDDDLDAPTSGFGDGQDVVPTSRRDAARTAVRRQPRPRPRRTGGDGGGDDHGRARTGRNLPMAIAVGVGLLAIGAICFKVGDIATTILIAVVLTLCAVELFSTLRDSGYNPATLLGLAAVPALAIAPLASPTYAYPIILGLSVISGLIWYLYVNPGPGTVGNLGVTFLGIFWIGGLGSFATLILGVGRTAQHAQHLKSNPGLGVIWGVVLVTVSYDVGAYFIGRFFGHAPLSPASPNKTIEGLFGGIAVGIFLPLLILKVADLHPLGNNVLRAFYFCLFCALVAPVGDLCESALKRDLDVKDMGDLLPGHGGVLDRFDGFLFVLPVAWFMVHLLGIHPF
jgi:phosphatidate cytidylyltransferase